MPGRCWAWLSISVASFSIGWAGMTISQWASGGLLVLAVVNLAVVLGCLTLLALGRYLVTQLKNVEVPASIQWPSISLIAPARNEERNIEKAVRSLARLDYPSLQITIIND